MIESSQKQKQLLHLVILEELDGLNEEYTTYVEKISANPEALMNPAKIDRIMNEADALLKVLRLGRVPQGERDGVVTRLKALNVSIFLPGAELLFDLVGEFEAT